MSIVTEARHAGEFILAEASGNRSRGAAVIADGVEIKVGQLLGLIAEGKGDVNVEAPSFTGTGNGAMTLANPAHGVGVQDGLYLVRLIEAGANSGQFEVVRPDGTVDGYATVAAAYDGQVKFTIADGGTDFAAAAQFSINVSMDDPEGAGSYAAFDPDATDGTETPVAIAIYPLAVDATSRKIAIIERDCTVNGRCIEWPQGFVDADIRGASLQLARAGIIVR